MFNLKHTLLTIMDRKYSCDVSIIVPMYNESDVIDSFFIEIKKIMDSLNNYSYEIICVDDGSNDDTLSILKKYSSADSRIKIISFSRNFHKEAAITAGFNNCSGKCSILIDADLQHPVDLIPQFLDEYEKGNDIVFGIKNNRSCDNFFKRFTAGIFYKIYNKLLNKNMPKNASDFILLDRKVIDTFNTYKEKNRFTRGLIYSLGFKTSRIEYSINQRAQGKTKWNYWKLWNFALDGITSFSTLSIRIWTYVGCILEIISIAYMFYSLTADAFSIINFVILFLFGLQFIAIGMIGEYIGRIFIETKNRPLYIIKEKVNL